MQNVTLRKITLKKVIDAVTAGDYEMAKDAFSNYTEVVGATYMSDESDNAQEITESLRLIKTHKSEDGKREAKVFRNHVDQEYQVKHYVDGKHQDKADYHTEDKDDAHDTALSHTKAKE